MKGHQRTEGKNDEWVTPRYITEALGEFDLDTCSPKVRPWEIARKHLTIEDDGLKTDWEGRVWCNPPFNRYERPLWMGKMAKHNNGIMLLPGNMETKAFYKYVFGIASGILILKGRPHFCYVDGEKAKANSGATIVLVSYGKENLAYLINSGLGVVIKEIA